MSDVSPHPVVDGAWAKLQGNWEDEAAHTRFLELSAAADALDLAAVHYRAEMNNSPERASRAAEGLARAAQLAQARLSEEVQLGRNHTPFRLFQRTTVVLLAFMAVGLLVGILTLVRR